jgi:hypothetical protein
MLRTRLSFSYLLLTVFASGCSLFSKAEKPVVQNPYTVISGALGEDYFHSPSGDIAGCYPKGWLQVDIRTIPMQNVLEVYTDENRERVLVLSEIPATAEFRRSVERDGMAALADESFAAKSDKQPGKLVITRPDQIYTENGKLVASYEYAESQSDSLHRKENRVVLFTTGSKFYELGMIELIPPRDPNQHVQNFRLLESVVASLEGVAEVRTTDTTSF